MSFSGLRKYWKTLQSVHSAVCPSMRIHASRPVPSFLRSPSYVRHHGAAATPATRIRKATWPSSRPNLLQERLTPDRQAFSRLAVVADGGRNGATSKKAVLADANYLNSSFGPGESGAAAFNK